MSTGELRVAQAVLWTAFVAGCGACNRHYLDAMIAPASNSSHFQTGGCISYLRDEFWHPVAVMRVIRVACADILHLKLGPSSIPTLPVKACRLQGCLFPTRAEQASNEDVRRAVHEGLRKRELSLCPIKS